MVIQEIKANGSEAYYLPDPASIVAKVSEVVEPGDVVIVMSNGSFGGIHPLLQQALTSR
jgi:UDP-N-acetylmuramate: L-alanyl-gamma-D-glutamyl-meso-diaminopimelate ligase